MRIASTTALILYLLLGTRPLSSALVAPLEAGLVRLATPPSHTQAVVVLAGGVRRADGDSATIDGTTSLTRLVEGVRLWRAAGGSPEVPLVLTGGVGDAFGTEPNAAAAMRVTALELGVPEAALVMDAASRNTKDSAVALAQLLPSAKSVVLVSNATHLPRAIGLFQKQGLRVTPAPVDFFAHDGGWSTADFRPSFARLERCTQAIHEHVGRAVAKLTGSST
jgi:uncharacterized SAM-binding protein YcdF (DUF218 family)